VRVCREPVPDPRTRRTVRLASPQDIKFHSRRVNKIGRKIATHSKAGEKRNGLELLRNEVVFCGAHQSALFRTEMLGEKGFPTGRRMRTKNEAFLGGNSTQDVVAGADMPSQLASLSFASRIYRRDNVACASVSYSSPLVTAQMRPLIQIFMKIA